MFSRTTGKNVKLSEENAVYKDGLPISIRVFRPGDQKDTRGESAVYSPKDATKVMRANNRTDKRVPFDIAHGMVNPSAPPESHEAVGWGDMRCDDSGVWLDNIRWREGFEEKLRDGAFAYISPTFLVDKRSRRITDLLTVSWTCIPATLDAEPLVASKVASTSTQPGARHLDTRKATMSEATPKDDLEQSKREDEGADDGAGKDDKDGAEEKSREDEGIDLSSIDVDSLSEDEAKALCVKLIDMIADMQSEDPEDDEDDEEDEEEEAKRDIVSALFNERLITYAQCKPMRGLRLRALLKEDRRLRADKTAAKAAVVRARKAEQREPAYENAVSEKLADARLPQIELGARDQDVEAYLRQFGHSYEKLGFARNKDAVYGANITSMARSHGKGN